MKNANKALKQISPKWTKNKALKELNILVAETCTLENQKRFSEDHVRWIARVLRFLEEAFGTESRYFQTFSGFTWKMEGSAIIGGPMRRQESMNPQLGIERVNREAYLQQLESARGLLLAAKDELESSNLESVYKGKDSGPEASIILKIINLAEYKLRKVIRSIPESEDEIQNAFEGLLVGGDLSYSRETESIEYSSKTYTPDFTIKKSDLAIELKLCHRDGREKEIIAEINDDILAYQTKYGNLIFIIYDLGLIRDVDRFIGNFEENQGVVVKVVKH